jgi:glycosyltransferase involved in cell wall biosynthesis
MQKITTMIQNIEFPLVSIILTTYNGEIFLEKQLGSLINQTYPHIEIIAVDDGSTDGTMSILNNYAEQYSNIKVFQNIKNLGFIKNFEKGCTLAQGEFLAFCDQDDYWLPEKIEKMVNAIGPSPMIYCDSVLCDSNLQSLGHKISDRVNGMPISSCLQQAIFGRVYGHAILFTKELFHKAHPFFDVITHDWWVSYIATLHGGIKYLPEALVYYRQHDDNVHGAIGNKSRKNKSQDDRSIKRKKEVDQARARINKFYQLCPDNLAKEKKILKALAKSYSSFSLSNNFLRMSLFFRYQHLLLAVKKRSSFRKILFCFKMFTMVK